MALEDVNIVAVVKRANAGSMRGRLAGVNSRRAGSGFRVDCKTRPWGEHPIDSAGRSGASSGMKIKTMLALLATVPLFAGCVERQVVYRDRPVYVEQPAPPPPQVEVVTVAPDPTYIWIGGSWEWNGRWVWYGGRWTHRPHPNAVWARGHWDNHGHNRVWISARWN